MVIAIVLALPALDTLDARAWSARKPVTTSPVSKTRQATAKKAPGAPVPAASTADQARSLLGRPGPVPDAAQWVRKLAAERELALAVQVAERCAADPRASAAVLLDVATSFGHGHDYPVQRSLLQRAWAIGAKHGPLMAPIAEAYADALLAAGDGEAAKSVIETALDRTLRGRRRALIERYLAAARLLGDMEGALQTLRGWHDPDAAVARAKLESELGDDEAAVATLQAAWRAFPGHRALQAAWLATLQRLDERTELAKVVADVVRLAPADPMPWLALLDAHLVARDEVAARALIDDLLRRYPHHDVLIEALVDREQRMGGDNERVRRIYQALLAAAPREPQYVEAFAEWLLQRGEDGAADAVLDRLGRTHLGEFGGLERRAQLLLSLNRNDAARKVAARMQQTRPGEPKLTRLLALLDERTGRGLDAERRWLEVAQLPPHPLPADRARAAEARQALVALYRKLALVKPRGDAIQVQLVRGPLELGPALLWFELQAQQEGGGAPDADWLALAGRIEGQWPQDPEVLHAVVSGLHARERPAEAMNALERLGKIDSDATEPIIVQAVEAAWQRGDTDLAHRGETLLLHGGARSSTTVLLRLGELHLRFGDGEGAAGLFRQAAAASPTDTRATARLASLYRLTGAAADEEQALREIVARATEADELEVAGQRVLTLALAAGRSADLVRWLDSVVPQHPRRDVIERFRLSAYDAWLRTAPVDRALGIAVAAPGPGPVGDALGSGDLASQVRALRQASLAKRPLPSALARQLLQSHNPVLRRDAALALGASGDAGAARLVVEHLQGGPDGDEDVMKAALCALGDLPAAPGGDAVLASLLSQRSEPWLAAWALARSGGAVAVAELERALRGIQGQHVLTVLALGHALARHPDAPAARLAIDALIDRSPLAGASDGDAARDAGVVWALRASGTAEGREELYRVALYAARLSLRTMALALLAEREPPHLPAAQLVAGNAAGLADVRGHLVRQTLAPWLAVGGDKLRAALAALDDDLGARLLEASHTRVDGRAWLHDWCAAVAAGVPRQGQVARACQSGR
jgi:tetratricopeptide (TPR) repeat protein